jgi:hypothetical protein
MKNLNILLIFLILSAAIIPASNGLPSHIDPANVTTSTSNLFALQLSLINELFSYRSGVYISLNKADIKGIQENLDSYMKTLQDNENILIGVEGNVYEELKRNANTLNQINDSVNQLSLLYEDGKLAYQNNQTQNATMIALNIRTIIGNLSSMQQEFIMEVVAQYPGMNTTLSQNGSSSFQTGSSSFNTTFKDIQLRWRAVELMLFDETVTLLLVPPLGGEPGDVILIKGNLTLPRNGSGVPDARVEIKIDGEVYKITTDKMGKYNFTYKIPYKKPGVYPVQVNFIPVTEPLLESSVKGSFFIKSTNTTLTINAIPAYGKFGDILNLSGRLVAKNLSGVADADIVITLDNNTLVNIKTDEKGYYEYKLNVPAVAEGKHIVNADFIPSEQPLFRSGNNTTITLMPTDTKLIISGKNIAYREDYFNISGQLLADNKHNVPVARVNVLLDKKEVGTAIVNRGEFFFSYWINKNSSLGNHTVTVKFIGYSPFLPSENSISVGIKNKPLLTRNIILLALAISIIIILYIRREKALKLWNNIFASKDKTRIDTRIQTETPSVTQVPMKEPEIKPQEPAVQVPELDLSKIYAHLETLIEQKQFNESISYSYKNARDYVSTSSGVKSTPQQTHLEFYNLIISSLTADAGEFLEITELYEIAMYSNIKIDATQAEKAVELLRKICESNHEKNK